MSAKAVPLDPVLGQIADYVAGRKPFSANACKVAYYCLLDSLACAFDALEHPECTKLLGPLVSGTTVQNGARVPGTTFELDPFKAAFDISTMVRWLDFNDAWFAAEGGHPSDNLGAIIATADWMSRSAKAPIKVKDVLAGIIKAYEIQGVLSLENSLVKRGFDSMPFMAMGSAAVATQLMGGTRDEIISAISNILMDGAPLRTYRKGRHTGWRKSWAAADASSRGVLRALMAMRGEMGYPGGASAEKWGFNDVVLGGKPLVLAQPLGSYIVENILFKVPFPALFHGQGASELALRFYPEVKQRVADIKAIHIRTHERAMEAANRPPPLNNHADRDHSMQYIVAVILLKGHLAAHDYSDEAATDTRIDELCAKMKLVEDKAFSKDFYAPAKRSNNTAMRIEFNDGTKTKELHVEYPLGHPRRRKEGLAMVERKFRHSVENTFAPKRAAAILAATSNPAKLMEAPFSSFVDLLVKTGA